MDYDISNGTIGNWTADDSWEWVLHIWNGSDETWDPTEASISEMDIGFDTHLAWIASNANLSMMPPVLIAMAGDGSWVSKRPLHVR